MRRIPTWALYTIAVVLLLFSLPGLIFAGHLAAKILYAVLIVIALVAFASALRRRRETV